MSKTIMAVGAHTGDAQLTCGMLLAKHAMAGDRIIIVDLTAGERGTPLGMTSSEFREQNVASAAEFAKGLGGESIVFDIPDGELYASKEIELKLARIMREKQVNSVLYHWPRSMHKDHVEASEITKHAIFYGALKYAGSKLNLIGAPSEVIKIITGTVVFFIAISHIFKIIKKIPHRFIAITEGMKQSSCII